MRDAIDIFNLSLRRVRDLHDLHASFSTRLTAAIDISDILRSEIVLCVSALDSFVHQLTLLGMLEVFDGYRSGTDAFNKFQVPMSRVFDLTRQTFEAEIRHRHGYLSFQHPDRIADAVRLFSNVELWSDVGKVLNSDKNSIKNNLTLIVDRRNKIAHAADLDPTFPNQLWPIDRSQVDYTLKTVDEIAQAIYSVVTLS